MPRRKEAPPTARRRLGRGLQSLISTPVEIEARPPEATPTAPASLEDGGPVLTRIPVEAIVANPHQPRERFDEQALARLATSIENQGLMQPIVVRERPGGGFELIAGERRWRAFSRLGRPTIPALVVDADDQTSAERSLIENLQREDLNPMERAEAFRRLADDHDLTHQAIAERVGLDRSSVTNHLRLCELDEFSQDAMRSGALGMGHGRALLAIANNAERTALAREAVRRAWSVRQLEEQVRTLRDGPRTRAKPEPTRRTSQIKDLEQRVSESLGARVVIQPGRKKGTGTMRISFFSLDEFEGILDRLGVPSE